MGRNAPTHGLRAPLTFLILIFFPGYIKEKAFAAEETDVEGVKVMIKKADDYYNTTSLIMSKIRNVTRGKFMKYMVL